MSVRKLTTALILSAGTLISGCGDQENLDIKETIERNLGKNCTYLGTDRDGNKQYDNDCSYNVTHSTFSSYSPSGISHYDQALQLYGPENVKLAEEFLKQYTVIESRVVNNTTLANGYVRDTKRTDTFLNESGDLAKANLQKGLEIEPPPQGFSRSLLQKAFDCFDKENGLDAGTYSTEEKATEVMTAYMTKCMVNE